MKKVFERVRIILMVTILLVATAFCWIRLLKIQIVEGEYLLSLSLNRLVGSQDIPAPRGEILDYNGVKLVQNSVSYNVVIEYSLFPKDVQKQNEILLKVVNILETDKVKWNNNLPISPKKPYAFTGNDETEINKVKSLLRLNTYATAENSIDRIVELYEISSEYTEDEIYKIASARYGMLLSEFNINNKFVIANGISIDTVAKIKELSFVLTGVDVLEEADRQYVSGTIFPHGIGTVGPIYADEYETLKDSGYKIDDVVGKGGIEFAMESYLRGKNGTKSITLNADKSTVSVDVTNEVVPGNSIKLTIDSAYQTKVEQILKDFIKSLEGNNSDGKVANAGAVVVLDAKTGAVRAMVTNPSYDIQDYIDNYNSVAKGENTPLMNRATNGLYRPGSTFKPITATAALLEKIENSHSTVYCGKKYTYYSDYQPECLGHHGAIDVIRALRVSCNVYFYDTARRLGTEKLEKYENLFGFGLPLNLEIGGATGYLATPETFSNVIKMDWSPGQQLQAGIGQSEIAVTPLHMAVQASVLANNGVRYRPYLVDSVYSYNMEELIYKTEPIIESTIKDDVGAFESVRQGMIEVANDVTGQYTLSNLPHKVAIKTGSPQSPRKYDSAIIGYYPAEDPEIAFSIIVEGGEFAKLMVGRIIEAYYQKD